MSFTLRILGEAERQMDAGAVPWVRVDGAGGRAIISTETMTLLNLSVGQTVCWTLYSEIMKMELASLQRQIAERDKPTN